MSLFPTLGRLQLVVLFCATMGGHATVSADTLTVTTTADAGAGSLRATLAAATNGDTIQFDAALNGQSITLTSGELAIDKNITIDGPGVDQLAVTKSSGTFRIFHVLLGHNVTIEGLTIDGKGTMGTGVWIDHASVTLDGCVVQGCHGSGGVLCSASFNDDSYVIVANSTIRNNQADTAGGGINNTASNGAHAILSIRSSVVSDNTVGSSDTASGGGIWNSGEMDITNSTVNGNVAGGNGSQVPFGTGGGISSQAGSAMFITSSTIRDNAAGLSGGGVYSLGLLTTIDSSTLSDNSAFGVNDLEGWGEGAGIYNGGPMTITNSTLSNNNSTRSAGGVSNRSSLTIDHSTLSGNLALEGPSIANYSSTVEIANTVLKGFSGGGPLNIYNTGTFTSHGYNLSSDNGSGVLTGTGDQINADPMLGPLQNNGGPTFTHELLTGSPAIDAGNPSFTPPPANDQRGALYQRVFNGRIDIGSLEVQPAPPTPTPTPTATVPATPSPTPSATAPPPATPTPTPTPTSTPTPTATPSPTAAQALNISTRLRVGTGDNLAIGGFIITGNAPKSVALRGIGPSLSNSGLSDVLADPILELRGLDGALIRQNDNWQDDFVSAEAIIGLGLAPQHYAESALVATLEPGSYTAVVAGKNQTSGIALVEIYDVDQTAASQLANISTRGFVQTGDSVLIGGFILGRGGNNTRVAVRGIGPSLAQAGLSPVLADPTLQLRDSDGALLISNDNWQDDPEQAMQLTAQGLAPTNANESGIFGSLPPGTFTVILAGKNGGTGIGLVEIYNVQ